ncbi:hypothetical protein IPdc08_00182 [archaeon]|nr:hypothetical protein IPdc08_00182 [archaeon]
MSILMKLTAARYVIKETISAISDQNLALFSVLDGILA